MQSDALVSVRRPELIIAERKKKEKKKKKKKKKNKRKRKQNFLNCGLFYPSRPQSKIERKQKVHGPC